MMHIFLSVGFICCGQEYINSSTSLCCVGNDGYPSVHPAGNATVMLQCCGSTVIRQDEECCNGIGYDPRRHVCADRPTPGLLIQVCLYVRECVRRADQQLCLGLLNECLHHVVFTQTIT